MPRRRRRPRHHRARHGLGLCPAPSKRIGADDGSGDDEASKGVDAHQPEPVKPVHHRSYTGSPPLRLACGGVAAVTRRSSSATVRRRSRRVPLATAPEDIDKSAVVPKHLGAGGAESVQRPLPTAR